jgi:hypothetical protein
VFFPGARRSEEVKACKEKEENFEVDVVGREEDDVVERQIDDEHVFEDVGDQLVADGDDQFGRQAEESRQQKQQKHEPRAKRTELSSRSIKRATVESINEVAGMFILKLLIMLILFASLTQQQVPMDSIVL